jgi:hypothetical protein
MADHKYEVQGGTIAKIDMLKALNDTKSDRIVLRLTLQGTSQLDLRVFAAGKDNNPLPGGEVPLHKPEYEEVSIKNRFKPGYGQTSIITREMVEKLSEDLLKLKARRYKPKNNKPPHNDREFIGWKVKEQQALAEFFLNPSPPAQAGTWDNDVE